MVYNSAPQPEPLTNQVVPKSMLAELEPLLKETPAAPPPLTTQWGYLPLLWINQGFDRSTSVLGGAGDWLRGQAAREMLGVSGIAMALVAAAWFLKDWLAWN